MAGCLEDLRSDASDLVDVRAWVREKPWWMLAVGAGAGFVAGKFLFSFSRSDEPRDERGHSSSRRFGALIAPLAAPLVSVAFSRLMRGPRGASDGDPSTSPFESLAFGPILTRLARMLA